MLELAPFTPYSSKPTAESRQAIARQVVNPSAALTEQIIQGLVQIVALEGPLLSSRLFGLYAKRGGMTKLSKIAKRRFVMALNKAIQDKQISMEFDTTPDNGVAVLWLPSMQRVVPREYGNRGFDEIPASELGEVMFELAAATTDEKNQLFQNMAELYGLTHLPKNATTRLEYVYIQCIG
ncbi:MAG: hypothetical protein JKY92_00360 [Magnetovibrio sp.]|nr:hypothetical protein [Magnetovibrio sp.]